MPLGRISLKKGKSPKYRQAVVDAVYRAMRETFDVPDGDLFMVVSEHADGEFVFDPHYLGVERSDDLAIIQLTVSNTRPLDKKQALFRRIADRLAESPGMRRQDVFINLVEVAKENWSFGNGVAQYASPAL